MRNLMWLGLLACGAAAAQEAVSYAQPARVSIFYLSGERTDYQRLADGGVGCTTTPDSRVAVPARPLAQGACEQSKARMRAQLVDALDAGALDP